MTEHISCEVMELDVPKARKALEDLIKEIESGGTLAEHGCEMILDDLKAIVKDLK